MFTYFINRCRIQRNPLIILHSASYSVYFLNTFAYTRKETPQWLRYGRPLRPSIQKNFREILELFLKVCQGNPIHRNALLQQCSCARASSVSVTRAYSCLCYCLFLLAASTIGPVRTRYGTAYCAVRLSILSAARPPATRASNLAQSLRTQAVYCGWVVQGLLQPPVPFHFHTVSFSCQSQRPTPSTTCYFPFSAIYINIFELLGTIDYIKEFK